MDYLADLFFKKIVGAQMMQHPHLGRRRLRLAWPTLAMVLLFGAPLALAEPVPVSVGEPVERGGRFASEEMDKGEQNGISGLACVSRNGGQRLCLAVNDEERFAEWAILDRIKLTPTGKRVQLLTVSDTQKDAIVGSMPSHNCKKLDDFAEFDGEGVAAANGKFYVIGSHACTRSKGKFKPSAFVLARVKATGEATGAQAVERTWRVSDVIANSALKGSLARPGADGTNIEGVAVIGSRIYLGFRTPVVAGKATILSADIESLFAAGDGRLTAPAGSFSLGFGNGVGIRDLASLPDGRLLVLSGPAMSEPVPYRLHIYDPKSQNLSMPLAELRSTEGKDKDGKTETAKAEGISVLDVTAEALTVLVTYDNINDGGPRIHTIALPKK